MRKLTRLVLKNFLCIIGIMVVQGSVVYAEPNQEVVHKNVAMTPFYWVIIIVGGCIAITLTYVSWRKYKGEKKKKKLKEDKTVD